MTLRGKNWSSDLALYLGICDTYAPFSTWGRFFCTLSDKGGIMSHVVKLVRRLAKDQKGAALIEYTVLLGILVVAVIALIVAVGNWVNGKWSTLQSQLS